MTLRATLRATPRAAAIELVPLSAREAYDRFAADYDRWQWQVFWHRNEWPHVRRMVAAAQSRARILDVGVGTGFYLGQLAPSARLACGLDVSAGMLRVARARLGAGACLVQADATAMPFRAAAFDLLLLNRVASHLCDLSALAAALARVLVPGGRLIVSDLAPEHDYVCTELGTPEAGILVETYKHAIEDWQRAAAPVGLRMVETVTLSADTLAWVPPDGFRSIERGSRRPIGFVLALEPRPA